MKKYFILFILLSFIPSLSFSFFEISFNMFTTIFYFKENEAIYADYVHKGKDKEKWDLGGRGVYLCAAFRLTDWVKPGFFIGKASMNEEIDSFNTYSSPEYQISHIDYGLDLRVFPFRKYFFTRFGILEGKSSHQLLTSDGRSVALFDFKGTGYQAGFGLDFDFEEACFGYNCGLQLEYLVRKAWAKDVKIKAPEITYDESKKASYREELISLGIYWFY